MPVYGPEGVELLAVSGYVLLLHTSFYGYELGPA
jgi:hypothetical protein